MSGLFIKHIIKQLPIIRRFFRPAIEPDVIMEEKWAADFSKTKGVRFELRADTAYESFLREKTLVLALKRSNCLAWAADTQYRYSDALIEGRIRLNPRGGYAAAGIAFRYLDEHTNYTVLFSSKGYFRIDVLRNGTPVPLAGWTEIPGVSVAVCSGGERGAEPASLGDSAFPAEALSFKIITRGDRILLALNRRWAAELKDSTIPAGRIALACVSYEDSAFTDFNSGSGAQRTAAEAVLESLSVESRPSEVEAAYNAWKEDCVPEPADRLRLAETFSVMGLHAQALAQLRENRNTPGYTQGRQELLLMAKQAAAQELLGEAEEALVSFFEGKERDSLWHEALVEKAKLLYLAQRHDELRELASLDGVKTLDGVKILDGVKTLESATLKTLLGHVFFEAGDYTAAAAAYDAAGALETKNGIPVKNAANTYDLLGNKKRALECYMEAGRRFLNENNYADLGTLMPKLLSLDAENWEAHALAGKWAFGIEDWTAAEAELKQAEVLRKRKKKPEDAAVIFLLGLLLVREGKREEALPCLERAADLEPEFPLFHFRAAENRFLLRDDPLDPELARRLKTALDLAPEKLPDQDGWIANLAAQVALRRGDLAEAERCLERASAKLGEVPAIRVNRAVHAYLAGSLDTALSILKAGKNEDPEGILANTAGNLLVRSGRYEEADEAYRGALAIAPKNTEFLTNRASCLIELGFYGEADDILTQARGITPTASVLELIAYVAVKKGEYGRAEAAYKSALEQDARNPSILISLGWLYAISFRWDDLEPLLAALEAQELQGESAVRRGELRAQLDGARYTAIACASCGREWKVPKSPPPVPLLRLYSEPPDELPAGSCTECGSTYCIGCAKKHLDKDKRFLCPSCGKTLRLIHDGLKKLVYDWAETSLPREKRP